MAAGAVVYVSDSNYLYPTLLSVASLRIHNPGLDVYVLYFYDDDTDVARAAPAGEPLGVRFINVRKDGRTPVGGIDWTQSHVSPTSLGRFALDEYLPTEISRFLYLDGDTMIAGDLQPLLALDLRLRPFAAARDALSFYTGDISRNGRFSREYLKGLGRGRGQPYFNSGVFLTDRAHWGELSKQAMQYLAAHPDRCVFHDQSALNAVLRDDVIEVSPRWNYQSRYRIWDESPSFTPTILHFTGAMKPWLAAVHPWRSEAVALAELGAALDLRDLPKQIPDDEKVQAHNHEFFSRREQVRRVIDLQRRRRSRRVRAVASVAEV